MKKILLVGAILAISVSELAAFPSLPWSRPSTSPEVGRTVMSAGEDVEIKASLDEKIESLVTLERWKETVEKNYPNAVVSYIEHVRKYGEACSGWVFLVNYVNNWMKSTNCGLAVDMNRVNEAALDLDSHGVSDLGAYLDKQTKIRSQLYSGDYTPAWNMLNGGPELVKKNTSLSQILSQLEKSVKSVAYSFKSNVTSVARAFKSKVKTVGGLLTSKLFGDKKSGSNDDKTVIYLKDL